MRLTPILAALLCLAGPALAQEGRLTLYTSQPNTDAQQTIDAFKARYPKVDATFVRDGTPRVLARLKAEAQAGQAQADVLLIADALSMAGLKAEGLLAPLPDVDLSAFPAGLSDPDKTWFATKLITTGIVANAKAPFVPTSWEDLARPEAKGLLALPSPLASGAAMIHTMTLVQTLPEGWAYYEKLAANGALSAGANGDVLRQVAGGEKLYGMIVDFLPIREAAKGAPVTFVFPKEGVSVVSEPVAVLKSTKNPEAAKAFVAFLLSPEGQALELKQGYLPARGDAAVPPGFPPRASIKLLPFDAGAALADEKKSRDRFSEIFSQ